MPRGRGISYRKTMINGSVATDPLPSNRKENSELVLLVPRNDVADQEVSIVIPALNEELTIEEFVDWCQEGLAQACVRGEVLIIDSSTDRTSEIALSRG